MQQRTPEASSGTRRLPAIRALPLVVGAFGLIALLTPLGAAEEPSHRVGALLALGGGLQVLHGIRRAGAAALRQAISGGAISILMGLLILATPLSAAGPVVLLLALTYGAEGVGYAAAARRATGRWRTIARLAAAADVTTAIALLVLTRTANIWIVA